MVLFSGRKGKKVIVPLFDMIVYVIIDAPYFTTFLNMVLTLLLAAIFILTVFVGLIHLHYPHCMHPCGLSSLHPCGLSSLHSCGLSSLHPCELSSLHASL